MVWPAFPDRVSCQRTISSIYEDRVVIYPRHGKYWHGFQITGEPDVVIVSSAGGSRGVKRGHNISWRVSEPEVTHSNTQAKITEFTQTTYCMYR